MNYYRLQQSLFDDGTWTLEVYNPADNTWHVAGVIDTYRSYHGFQPADRTWNPYYLNATDGTDVEQLAGILATMYAHRYFHVRHRAPVEEARSMGLFN